MKTFSTLTLSIFSIITCVKHQTFGSPSPSGRSCLSIHETKGKCVSFEMCPPFLEMLKSAQSGMLTIDKLRLLQRLTCGFDRNDPMICCPDTEIITRGNPFVFDTQSQGKIKPTNREPDLTPQQETQHIPTSTERQKVTTRPAEKLNTKPPFNVTKATPDPSSTQATVTEVGTNNKQQGSSGASTLLSHPSYGLIPPIKSCSNSVNSDRIVGGTEATLASYPWMARIGYLNLETNEVEFYCGGTIINNRYILTAAHCTEEIDDEYRPVVVRLGEHDIRTTEDCSPYIGCIKTVDYVIEKVIPHKQYDKEDKSNDIELIRVNRNISFESLAVRPICLPFTSEYNIKESWGKIFERNQSLNIKTWVAGWGRTKWNLAEGSNILQEVQLPLVSNEQCLHNYTSRVQITKKQICAGGIKSKDSCGGDSGGPLMYPFPLNNEAKFFQLGVVSFGPVQCGQSAGLPGVYTRVSAYLKWILDNMEP